MTDGAGQTVYIMEEKGLSRMNTFPGGRNCLSIRKRRFSGSGVNMRAYPGTGGAVVANWAGV